MKEPGEYFYLIMDPNPREIGAGSALRRGRPPGERLRREIPFSELPAGCRRLVFSTSTGRSGDSSVKASSIGGIRTGRSTTREAAMDFDPDDAQQYLEGVEYPASKEELISAAENNDAPEGLIGMLGSLSRPEFSGPEEVTEELRAFPQSS